MRIIWSRPALDDLHSIDYWLTEEATAAVAVRVVTTIRHRSKFLEDFPRGDRPYRDDQQVFRVFDTPCLIRYRISGGVVEVIRVHHERENWRVEP